MTLIPRPLSMRRRSLAPWLVSTWVWASAVLVPGQADADLMSPDMTPPRVSIKSPKDGLQLPAGTQQITVKVSAKDPETDVETVVLKVDGEVVKKDRSPPFRFTDVTLEPGRHELVAIAINYHGARRKSKPVVVTVPEPEPEPQLSKSVTGPEDKASDAAMTGSGADAKAKTDAKADGATRTETRPEPADAERAAAPEPQTRDGCFASVRPRSMLGSGLALLFAAFAGLMLRRRP